jgi:hypothetical protein
VLAVQNRVKRNADTATPRGGRPHAAATRRGRAAPDAWDPEAPLDPDPRTRGPGTSSPRGGPHASRERTLLRRFQKSGARSKQGHRQLFLTDENALLHSTCTTGAVPGFPGQQERALVRGDRRPGLTRAAPRPGRWGQLCQLKPSPAGTWRLRARTDAPFCWRVPRAGGWQRQRQRQRGSGRILSLAMAFAWVCRRQRARAESGTPRTLTGAENSAQCTATEQPAGRSFSWRCPRKLRCARSTLDTGSTDVINASVIKVPCP